MIINDLDGYYIVFDTKNWNTELDTLIIYPTKKVISMNNISIHSIDTVCLKEACPVHHLCARFERYQKLRKSEKVFSILNPDHIACNEQGCAYRLQKKIIRMARGFRRMFGTIPSANTPHFWHFSPYISESTYCKAKRGAILIAPDVQQKLLRLFEQNGADISIGFDEYVEQEGYEEVDTASCKKI